MKLFNTIGFTGFLAVSLGLSTVSCAQDGNQFHDDVSNHRNVSKYSPEAGIGGQDSQPASRAPLPNVISDVSLLELIKYSPEDQVELQRSSIADKMKKESRTNTTKRHSWFDFVPQEGVNYQVEALKIKESVYQCESSSTESVPVGERESDPRDSKPKDPDYASFNSFTIHIFQNLNNPTHAEGFAMDAQTNMGRVVLEEKNLWLANNQYKKDVEQIDRENAKAMMAYKLEMDDYNQRYRPSTQQYGPQSTYTGSGFSNYSHDNYGAGVSDNSRTYSYNQTSVPRPPAVPYTRPYPPRPYMETRYVNELDNRHKPSTSFHLSFQGNTLVSLACQKFVKNYADKSSLGGGTKAYGSVGGGMSFSQTKHTNEAHCESTEMVGYVYMSSLGKSLNGVRCRRMASSQPQRLGNDQSRPIEASPSTQDYNPAQTVTQPLNKGPSSSLFGPVQSPPYTEPLSDNNQALIYRRPY